jgi:hypothetical protein
MPRFSIRNPYFIVVVCLALAVVGVNALSRMPVDLFPSINLPEVVVATFYNGMPPGDIEVDITNPLERFFTQASGVDHMESRSLLGVSIIRRDRRQRQHSAVQRTSVLGAPRSRRPGALESDQRLRDQEQRISRDVRVAWASANDAYQRIDVTAQFLRQAALALDLAQGRYGLGLSSIIELSQAQLNLTEAEIENLNAKYDYQTQYSALQYTLGLLR